MLPIGSAYPVLTPRETAPPSARAGEAMETLVSATPAAAKIALRIGRASWARLTRLLSRLFKSPETGQKTRGGPLRSDRCTRGMPRDAHRAPGRPRGGRVRA